TERGACRELLVRLGLSDSLLASVREVLATGEAPGPDLPDRIARPVVVASPGDALKSAAGAVVGAATDPDSRVRPDRARVVAMRRGITDVGMLAIALFPTPVAAKGRAARPR